VLLGGCSTLKLVYNQADEAAYWWLDGYIDVTDKQKPLVRDALTQLHQWHRQTQLPQYIALLKKMRAMAPYDIQAEQVCAITQDMQNSFAAVLHQLEPDAVNLVGQLSNAQLQYLRKKYDKLNLEWREDYVDGSEEKRLRSRSKQLRNRLEDFYGSLDATQREMINQGLVKSSFQPLTSYEERLRRQVDAIQTFTRISHGSSPALAQAQFKAWIDRSFNSPDEAYRVYSQTLKQENCERFAKLHNSTSPAQRERLAESLRNYETIFQGLVLKN